MKKKIKKKMNRKLLVKKLDLYFSQYIRRRDNYTCYTCGKTRATAVIQCGHLITRSKQSIRWDERNSRAQCSGCNFLHEHQPEIYTQKYIKECGLEAYEKLILDSNTRPKLTMLQLVAMLEHYKKLGKERDEA